jgi:hypothetical protein
MHLCMLHNLCAVPEEAQCSNTESNDVREEFKHAVVEVEEGGSS